MMFSHLSQMQSRRTLAGGNLKRGITISVFKKIHDVLKFFPCAIWTFPRLVF